MSFKMGYLAVVSELSRKISGIVAELAEAEQARLQAAGTFVELEELAREIGDEVTRQLLGGELADRGNAAASDTALCPDCGESRHQNEAHHRRLTSLRGEVSDREPTFYCRDCRRSFFPLASRMGLPTRAMLTPKVNKAMVWPGSNLIVFRWPPKRSSASRDCRFPIAAFVAKLNLLVPPVS